MGKGACMGKGSVDRWMSWQPSTGHCASITFVPSNVNFS